MIERISWDFVKKGALNSFIRRNVPVVITDIDSSLPLIDWTIERLIEKYGHVKIRVLKSEGQYFSYDEVKERTIVQMPLLDFYRKGVLYPGSDGFYYTLGRSPVDQFDEFKSYMCLPQSLARIVDGALRKPERNIWLSPRGTRTALHFDAVENLNLQIEGSKSFLIYPPRIKQMHTCKWHSQAAYVSRVDPRHQTHIEEFPYETGQDVQLSAGEMLYLPYGWWHQVDTIGDLNLNANFWWFPRIKLLSFPQQTLRGAAVLVNRMGQHPHARAEKN